MSTDHSKNENKPKSQLRNSKRKEVDTMNYAKPAITSINAAKSAIQGQTKHAAPVDSADPPKLITTVNAYEADE
jgi:hypothetical protein